MPFALKITAHTPVGILSGTAVEGTESECADYRDKLLNAGIGELRLVDDTKLHMVPAELVEVSAFSFEIVEI